MLYAHYSVENHTWGRDVYVYICVCLYVSLDERQ